MRRRVLRGVHVGGSGSAGKSLARLIRVIRERSGLAGLHPETLNVRLPHWYAVYPDIAILAHEYGHHEHVFLERCELYGRPALIVRTSQNHWGSAVLEILAVERVRRNHRIRTGGRIAVTVWDRGPRRPREPRCS